jgi:hypothetical protein
MRIPPLRGGMTRREAGGGRQMQIPPLRCGMTRQAALRNDKARAQTRPDASGGEGWKVCVCQERGVTVFAGERGCEAVQQVERPVDGERGVVPAQGAVAGG